MQVRWSSKRQDGISVIELLLCVSMLTALAAIAVPRFLTSRDRAQEAVATATMRTIYAAQVIYATQYPERGFANDVAKLGSAATGAALIEWPGGCSAQPCRRSGYDFSVLDASGAPVTNYMVIAVPVNQRSAGDEYCMDAGAAIGSLRDPSACPPEMAPLNVGIRNGNQ